MERQWIKLVIFINRRESIGSGDCKQWEYELEFNLILVNESEYFTRLGWLQIK